MAAGGDGRRRRRVCVVGAGPAGLVACKTLLEHGFDPVVLEAGSAVGGTFRTKSYDDGRLVSSKFITAFSDFRMGPDVPDHPSITDYLAYLEDYCAQFNLWPHIRFGHRVEEISSTTAPDGRRMYQVRVSATAPDAQAQPIRLERSASHFSCGAESDDGANSAASSDGESEASAGTPRSAASSVSALSVDDSGQLHVDAVCICSGLHNEPYIPDLPGNFSGQVLHSSRYKDKQMFADKRVLVVGAGETGLDLVYRAIQVTKDVFLCARSGFLSVPYVIGNGVPLDTFITNLFECSHLHPLLERFKVKWRLSTPFIRLGFLLGTGSSCGYNQWAGCKPSTQVRRGHLIINKSTDAMPWINRKPKAASWLGRNLYSWLDRTPLAEQLRDREIQVTRRIAKVDGTTVSFENGQQADFDTIVLATGYAVRFPFLKGACLPDATGVLPDGLPRQDLLPSEHNICNPDEVTKAFIGFVRPNVGSIPPMAELQVMWWIQRLRGEIGPPSKVPTYHLLGNNPRTGAYAVDYGAYMHDLGRDLGCAPSMREMLARPRVLIAWAMGQAYVTLFRLRGPFKLQRAWDIAESELYGPVTQRPWLSNLVFAGLILVFAVLNLFAMLLDPLAKISPGRPTPAPHPACRGSAALVTPTKKKIIT